MTNRKLATQHTAVTRSLCIS